MLKLVVNNKTNITNSPLHRKLLVTQFLLAMSAGANFLMFLIIVFS